MTTESERLGEFAKFSHPSDPDGILLEIIAARCLGIEYGDPGPKLDPDRCVQCWGTHHMWYGNCWGFKHTPPGLSACKHECHENEVWLA